MKSKLFLLATILLLSVSAFAQKQAPENSEAIYSEQPATPTSNPTPEATAAPVKKTDEQIAEEESAKVRRDTEQPAEVKKEELTKESMEKKEETVSDKVEKTPEAQPAKVKSRPLPAPTRHVVILAEAAPITTWVPLKYGGSVTGHITNSFGIELSYLNGKLNADDLGFDSVGDIKERRIDAVLRYYTGKSFSVFAGYSMQKTTAEISTKTLAANTSLPFKDTTVNAAGVLMGISNRWQWKSGFTFGIDWLSVYLPLTTSVDNDLRKQFSNFSDQQTYKDIEDTYQKIENYPRVSILELGLGWTF